MLFQKRLMAILAIAAFALVTGSSCSKKDDTPNPTASFSYAAAYNSNTHAPATVKFTNNSTNAGEYLWDFGDGSTSSSSSPSHKYTTAGTFTVTLKSSVGSKSNTASQTLNILPAYTKAKVTRLTLISTTQAFPFTGYFRITDGSGAELYKTPNLSITGPSYYAPPTPPTLSNMSATYNIELWKYNQFSSDTRLAATALKLSIFAAGDIAESSYPTSITGSNGLSYNLQWE